MNAVDSRCTHLNRVRTETPRTPNGGEECLAIGSRWAHLRLCLECGHVGRSDSSPNTHATKHYYATKHPVMKSFERGEDWGYCYVEAMMLEPAPRPRAT